MLPGLLRQRPTPLFLPSSAVLGPDHPNVASALSNIAAVCHKTGKTAEGVAASDRSSAILKRALGSKHPSVQSAKATALALWGPQPEDKARRPLRNIAQETDRTHACGDRRPSFLRRDY